MGCGAWGRGSRLLLEMHLNPGTIIRSRGQAHGDRCTTTVMCRSIRHAMKRIGANFGLVEVPNAGVPLADTGPAIARRTLTLLVLAVPFSGP